MRRASARRDRAAGTAATAGWVPAGTAATGRSGGTESGRGQTLWRSQIWRTTATRTTPTAIGAPRLAGSPGRVIANAVTASPR